MMARSDSLQDLSANVPISIIAHQAINKQKRDFIELLKQITTIQIWVRD